MSSHGLDASHPSPTEYDQMRRTFVDRVLAGEIYNLDKIDDDIAIWSRSKEPEAECELHEWLGLTEKEYDLFVEKPESLKVILSARKYGTDVFSTLAANNNGSCRDSSDLPGV